MINLDALDKTYAAATPGELRGVGYRLSHVNNTRIEYDVRHIDEIGEPGYGQPYQAIPFARYQDAQWHAAIHNAYPALAAELRELRALVEMADEFVIDRDHRITVSNRGRAHWAVVQDGILNLNKDGQWQWEPQPSSRDDEFLAACRFESLAEAMAAARAAVDAARVVKP